MLGIITVGEPACGMNAAMRAFVRFTVTHGFKVLGIQDGFSGLLQDQVSGLIAAEQQMFALFFSSLITVCRVRIRLLVHSGYHMCNSPAVLIQKVLYAVA